MAHALQMQGLRVTVFEQDESLQARPRDWNLGMFKNQTQLYECLPEHLRKQIEAAEVDGLGAAADEIMPVYDGASGEILKRIPLAHNVRLARKRLLEILSADINIKYGKRLKEVSSDRKLATATFEDGTLEMGNLLIGADGAHSVVRDFLVGSEDGSVVKLPFVVSSCIAKLPIEAAVKFKEYARRLMVVFHPHGYFNWIGIHDARGNSSPGEWMFMMMMSWIPSDDSHDIRSLQGDSILADLKQRAQSFEEGIRFIWQSIPEGTQCWHNRLSHWIPREWDNINATVTLTGDAAHPMTFHRGRGFNDAVNDAALFARKIKEHGISVAAVSAYEKELVSYAQEAVQDSTDTSMLFHDWQKLVQSPLLKKN